MAGPSRASAPGRSDKGARHLLVFSASPDQASCRTPGQPSRCQGLKHQERQGPGRRCRVQERALDQESDIRRDVRNPNRVWA